MSGLEEMAAVEEEEDWCRLREGEEEARMPARRGEGTIGVVDAEGGLGRRERCLLLRVVEELGLGTDREEDAMDDAREI